MTPERYRQIAVASLVALFVVIVAGAAVRLTNSGLGCDDWPNCNRTTVRRRLVEACRDRAGQPPVQRDRDDRRARRRAPVASGASHGPAARSAWRGRWSRWSLPTRCWAVSRCSSTCIRWRCRDTCCWRWRRSRSTSCSSSAARHRGRTWTVTHARCDWCGRSSPARRPRSSPARSSPDRARTPVTRTLPRLDLDIESIARVHGTMVMATIATMFALGGRISRRSERSGRC